MGKKRACEIAGYRAARVDFRLRGILGADWLALGSVGGEDWAAGVSRAVAVWADWLSLGSASGRSKQDCAGILRCCDVTV